MRGETIIKKVNVTSLDVIFIFSDMKKSEKPFFVQNLTEQLKGATSIVLIDYSGLNVKQQQELKKRLRGVQAEMGVVKNTLLKLASKGAKLSEGSLSDSVLSGPTATIITEADPIAPLQVLYQFSKEFGIPSFKVGIIEGNFRDKESLEKLATLPSKEVLVSYAVGTIASPMYGLVYTLQGNLQKLVYVLNAKQKSQ